jgi:broad specificity phosphatase PhoE
MKLYFTRHGESDANIQHVISNRESLFYLTEHGRDRARTLADHLKAILFTTIYSSPVLRARETSEILSQILNVPYQVTEALREYDCGILEEKSDEESWRLHRYYYEDWTLRHNYLNKPEGGECFVDIQKRFVPFIESLKRDGDENILLVAHGGLFHLMLPLVLSNIDHEFVDAHGIGHTECVIAELHGDEFICRQWGDVQFSL